MRFFDFFRRPSERDQFANAVMRRVRQLGWSGKLVYDREGFQLVYGAGQEKLFLGNVFKDWREADASAKQSNVNQVAAALFEFREGGNFDDLEASLPALLPVLRNRRDLETLWLHEELDDKRDGWDGAIQPMCDALAVVVAVDRPATISLLRGVKLREWNISLQPLLKRAIANLREISPVSFERDPAGFYISQYNDQYDCSRLLVPEVFDRLPLNGSPVVIPAVRNGMVVAGENDVSGLIAMSKFADEEILKATRPISYLPLVRRGADWVVFEPDDPALEPLQEMRVKQMLWDYECQRELLQSYCDRAGRDVHVAKVEPRKFNAGVRVRTFSTWAQGASTLLPRTDAVAIYQSDKERWLIRSWDDVWAVCGGTFSDEGMYPSRFLTPASMSESQLARLDAEFGAPTWLPPPAKDAHLIG